MPRHIKQHSLRGATLARIAKKTQDRADAIRPINTDSGSMESMIDAATAKALSEFAAIMRAAGVSEPRLR